MVDIEFGQFVPPQGTADQQRQDHVVPLPFQGRAVRDRQQLLGLLAGQPVSEARSLLADVGNFGEVRRLLGSDHAVAFGLAHQLPHSREPDGDGRRGQGLHSGLPLHEKGPGERSAGTELEQIIQGFGVVAPGVRRLDRVEDQFSE